MPKKPTNESSRVQYIIRRVPMVIGDIRYHTIATDDAIKNRIGAIIKNSDKKEVSKISKYFRNI